MTDGPATGPGAVAGGSGGGRAAVVATAGHVDHGKSALLRALTGEDPDRLAEERRRGLTIELGFVRTRTPGGEPVAFVDVPGHHRYLPTALAGMATAPAVLLVVAADRGWMPQTEEHLAAIRAFGTAEVLLAVTRGDLADPGPALADASARLARAGLGEAAAVAVSARTGHGLDALRERLDALAARQRAAADGAAPVRLWLDRSFTRPGAGTVVTGTLTAGTVAVGDELELAPQGRPVTVRGLHLLGAPAERVTAPARVAVALRRVAREETGRGGALLTPGRWWRTGEVDVRVVPPAEAPRLPAEPLVHCGTAVTAARLRPLADGAVRLRLRRPLDLHLGDRLLLHDPGRRQLVAATVLDVAPPPLDRRGAAAARGRELAGLPDGPAAGAALLRWRGLIRRAELTAMGAAAPPDAVAAGDWLLDAAHAVRLRRRLRGLLADAAPYGLPPAAARQALGLPEETAPALPAALGGAAVTLRGGRLHPAGPQGALPARLAGALAALRAGWRTAPFRAPGRGRLAELGLRPADLALLADRGELERHGDGTVLLPPGAAGAAAARLRALPQPFTVGECRRALDTSRAVALALLATLDAAGRTVRAADGTRTLRPAARGDAGGPVSGR